jgi:DNA-binding LacI/PurR family transcriptional regulator
MADVAVHAGVSVTTVSLVINDRQGSGISESTRQRVLTAVRELHYRPNRTAANLRLSRTQVLGLHITESMLARKSPFALSILPFLISAADKRHYQLMTFTDRDDGTARIAELCGQRAVDGFVLTDTSIDDPRARYLAEQGFPFATMGRLAADLPQHWVDVDNRQAMRTALDHLASRGHKAIAFAAPREDGYWWDERVDAFVEWSKEHGTRDASSWVVRAPMSHLAPRVNALLADRRPTALVAAGNGAVVPCYRAVNALGLQVGKDLAVVGFDPELWMLDPPLTTLTVPFPKLAESLVDRIHRQIQGSPSPARGTLVHSELVVRESG